MTSPQRKGGLARAAALSPERRVEIARAAARTRWLKPRDVRPPSTAAAAEIKADRKRRRVLREILRTVATINDPDLLNLARDTLKKIAQNPINRKDEKP